MQAVNLIPVDLRVGGGSSGGRSGGAVYVVLGGLAVLAALMALYALSASGMTRAQSTLAGLQTRVQQVRAASTGDVAPGQVRAQRTQTTAAVRQLVEQRMDWAALLDNLGRTLPADTSLTGLDASLEGAKDAAVAAPTTAGATTGPSVQLKGCSPSQNAVAQLMPRLRAIPGVAGVQLVSSAIGDPSNITAGATNTGTACQGAAFEVVLMMEPLAATAAAAATTPGATTTTPGAAAPAAATTAPAASTTAPAPATGAGG